MITGTSMANQAIKILTYVDNSIYPAAEKSDDDIVTALYNMHNLFPSYAIITCPVRHGHFFYISNNCKAVFGYDPEYMAANLKALSRYYSQVHENDMKELQECMILLENFMKTQLPGDFHQLRIVSHYRFRQPDGRYVYLHDEKATLVTSEGKIIHYSLIRQMNDVISFTGVKIEIYKQDIEKHKLFECKSSSAQRKLSGRENDLVVLLKKGMTTKEIASHLQISHHTVRNIKSKMFEKYSVNNAIELLNMTAN